MALSLRNYDVNTSGHPSDVYRERGQLLNSLVSGFGWLHVNLNKSGWPELCATVTPSLVQDGTN